MARYIDADRLKEAFSTDTQHLSTFDPDLYDLIVLDIEEAPTADVVEVKHGYWKTVPMFDEPDCDYLSFECSCCGNLDVCEENYCSECGAKMDGGNAE